MQTINTEKFYNLLYYAEFSKAQEMAQHLSIDELWDLIIAINFPEPTLVSYGYIISLLIQDEKPEYHYLASRLLIEQLKTFEGAYASGYWHATRAHELNAANPVFQNFLLGFYSLPNQLLSNEDALNLASEILIKDPTNIEALKIQSLISKFSNII